MCQRQAHASIVSHDLPHLVQDPPHTHWCPYALDDSALLCSIAQPLGLAVWAAQARADATLVDGLDLHSYSYLSWRECI